MAFVMDNAEMPWEAYVAGIDRSGGLEGMNRVSEVNTAWMEEVKLSRVERFTFEGARHNEDWLDNLPRRGVEYMMTHEAPRGERPTIEGWLMYPLEYEEGMKYPLVISIHGGPHSAYRETWFPEFQMIAAKGIFVLYINPRGSGGYGSHFSSMIMEAWGIDDYKDYMQAVDLIIERGIVDESNLGVTGGSYGGFMTNWITAHNDRFKCAITARSICNWISFYGASDASGLVESEFGGRPWPFRSDDEGSWNRAMMLSPISWADQVVTPTLIIHSINDYRCPLVEAETWYRALQKNEVPVQMVLFPDSTHDLSRTGEPWLLVRRLHEYVDWFEAYLVLDEPVVDADGPIRR
jgi:dipeptidyl aminopeptidase/acylaminoacyl peptidase